MQSLKKKLINGIMILGLSFGLIVSAIASVESDFFNSTKALAEQGDATAQSLTGYHYNKGIGVRQDYQKALYWLKKSSDQGNSSGQYSLGYAYSTGQGVHQDYSKAIYWYQKSAAQNNSLAQYSLGVMYSYGEGVRPSKTTAKEWFGKSCDNSSQYGCDSYRELNEQGY